MSSSNARQPTKNNLVVLEAGDEFEDFPAQAWEKVGEQKPSNLWEEQWEDDDHLDDDFAEVLKAEIAKKALEDYIETIQSRFSKAHVLIDALGDSLAKTSVYSEDLATVLTFYTSILMSGDHLDQTIGPTNLARHN